MNAASESRRDFLKGGTALGAAFLAGPVPAAPAGATRRSRFARRTLGTGAHALEVSALGLGCMGMSYHRSFIPERAVSIALIRKAVDLGVTLFDTAEAYGPRTNEGVVERRWRPCARMS